jgi:hypothetical protein
MPEKTCPLDQATTPRPTPAAREAMSEKTCPLDQAHPRRVASTPPRLTRARSGLVASLSTTPPRLTRARSGLVASLLLALACSGEPDPSGLPEPLARHQAAAAAASPTATTSPGGTPSSPPATPGSSPAAAPPAATPPTAIATCEALQAAAARNPPDAAIQLELCPESPTTPAILRNALLMAESPAAAAALIPRLAAAPELVGLARLVALDRTGPSATPPGQPPPAPPPAPAELPDPVSAAVSPITDSVLGAVQLAIIQQTQSGLTQDQRTRATAYLARVHQEALQQLGLGDGQPLPPLARVLAGRFLHFGREFSRMYWQRRVAGLEGLFASTELQLLRLVLALERSPHLTDDALLAVEHQRSRRHLQGSGVAERIARTLGAATPAISPADLLPLPHEFDRLLDHGFVELVFQRALFLAGEQPGGFGIAPVAEMLRRQLETRDLQAYSATLERRIADARALSPAPPEQGNQVLPARVVLAWPSEAAAADEADAWLRLATPAADLPRRHALARASLLLRERPDAARLLLRRALDPATPRDPVRVGLLLDLLARQDDESLASLRLRVAAGPQPPLGDDAVRRAHALAARDAGLLPR